MLLNKPSIIIIIRYIHHLYYFYVLFFHSIFQPINIVKFCDDLRAESGGLFIQNIHLSSNLYDPTKEYEIKSQLSGDPEPHRASGVLIRNCQLLRFDFPISFEIFVAAFPDIHIPNVIPKDTILVLQCREKACITISVATITDFQSVYRAQGMCLTPNWSEYPHYLPHIFSMQLFC